jgi:pyoverdine/dityrosine biosynthesis protein Dit1
MRERKMKLMSFVNKTCKKYYTDRDYEQIDLFRLIKKKWDIDRVIYPGSYVHISPSFVFSDVVYMDSDTNAKKFFKSDDVKNYICERKEYSDNLKFSFYG